ncbi:uncharacterized protein [Haliotis asinina]|uniref:uncharacterized protein isoform X2 n=1 Tax=Haliotis asinina TaxID=109174 RepID=UPI00353226D2
MAVEFTGTESPISQKPETMNPCHLFCLLIFMTFLPGTTGASLTTSPSQIKIGGSNPTPQLIVTCRPDAPGITQVFNIQIGKKSASGTKQAILEMTNTDSSVQVVDTSLQQRMTASGSISGAARSIQFFLTDLRCADAASTYYCTTLYLTDTSGSDESTTNITARTYPEQIEMFPSPDRVKYDDGQLISFRCTGRIGNQFDEDSLQKLWTWEWRSTDNEFSSWTRYPDNQNITYDTPISSTECQYAGASTLVHSISKLDNGRQFRCSVISANYGANKTVYIVGQQPTWKMSTSATLTSGQQPSRPTTPPASATCVQENQQSSLGVGLAIGVCVMLVVDAICLGLAFVFRDKLVGCISGPKNTSSAEMPVFSKRLQADATVISPVGIQTQGDEYEVPDDRNDYDALQSDVADVPDTYEKIRTYQNV